MTAKEAFGVVVRTLGLGTALYGANELAGAIGAEMAVRSATSGVPTFQGITTSVTSGPIGVAVTLALLTIAVGLFLLLRAQTVAYVCYRDK
jgi:hypothetical protein